MLGKKKALEEFNMLKRESLVGAIVYYDGQHNDSRMNLAIAQTACQWGAHIANHVEVTSLLRQSADGGVARLAGVHVRDMLTGDEWDIRAKCVVNAAGPFVDTIRRMDEPAVQPMVQPSTGVHVILPDYYSPRKMGLLDPSTSDGRVIFFLPWNGCTIAGTTDAPTTLTYLPAPTESEIQFILSEIKSYLSPDIKVRRGDVLAAWAGIRPLVSDPTSKDTQSIVRNHCTCAHAARRRRRRGRH